MLKEAELAFAQFPIEVAVAMIAAQLGGGSRSDLVRRL
jgi:hypothetical protein